MKLRHVIRDRLFLGWVLGLATVGGVSAIVGGLVIFGGLYDTSARAPHAKIMAWAIHHTMIHSVARRADDSGDAPDAATFRSGAADYEAHCLACHGGPGMDRASWARTMLPTPPFLIDASDHWSRRELYEILQNGVKMTAMPAWGEIENRRQISDVVTFVQIMPKLTPAEFQRAMAQAKAERERRSGTSTSSVGGSALQD